jgi:hypothetical protein
MIEGLGGARGEPHAERHENKLATETQGNRLNAELAKLAEPSAHDVLGESACIERFAYLRSVRLQADLAKSG